MIYHRYRREALREVSQTLALTVLGCVCLLSSSGCKSKSAERQPSTEVAAPAPAPIRFSDETHSFGLRSVYQDGSQSHNYSILEGIGGGVAMLDYDNDGWLDLFFPSGGALQSGMPPTGLPSTLWRNREGQTYSNVSEHAIVDNAPFFTHGVASADVDNDGFPDLLVTGYGGLQYFHNQGDGSFIECSSDVGLIDGSWSTSACWFDLNRDGNLDLFVTHYVDWSWENNPACGTPAAPDRCTPYDFDGLNDSVFLSSGDGSFQDVSATIGLAEQGKGLGVVAADFNADGIADVYVANDTSNNFYYENPGTGQLAEQGTYNGTALDERGIPNGSMGIAVCDFNLDQHPDIWVTNFENETCALYANTGQNSFRCITNSVGVNALGKLFVGFGTLAADLDHDGDEDIVVANGHLQLRAPLAQEQLILRNDHGKRLVRVAETNGYFAETHVGRGLVAGDIDRDGRLDLVFSNSLEPAALLLNRSEISDPSWIGVQLVGRRSPRDPVGARIVLHIDGEPSSRFVYSGGSYLSQGPYSLHWGLQEEVPLTATVYWPSGVEQKIEQLRPRQMHTIVEPD